MEKHERWSNLALFPGLPVLRFAFSVIHGSRRTKNRGGLGTRLGLTRECTGSANVKAQGSRFEFIESGRCHRFFVASCFMSDKGLLIDIRGISAGYT